MRVKYQRAPITTEWTVGAKANTGDGILAAEKLGAALDIMEDAWWGPTVPLVGAPWFALSERNSPGSIIVNMAGKRFMNESMPYVEACHHMYGGEYGQGPGPGENIPAWLVFDQQYRDRYIFAGLQPGQRIPKKWLESGVIVKADTLEELAAKAGLPADALTATVERFNGFARSGVDEDFHRGESAYDRYYGDPTNKPNPNLGEISHAPYYAAKMVPGDLGTKGGIRTDVHGRALRDDGSVIDGLYAAGNVSAPVMGHTYPGPGGTIGPAMTFGYLAALHIAGKSLTCRSISTRRSAPSSTRSNSRGPVAISSSTTSASARARDPMDKRELRYLVDDTPQVLPTFGNVAPSFHMTEPPTVKFPGIDIELSQGAARQRGGVRARPDPAVGHRPRGHQVHRHLGQGQGRGDLVGDDGHHAGRHAAVDAEAVDLRPRRGRLRRRARTVDVVGAAGARTRLRAVHPGVAAAGAAVPDVRRPQPAALRSRIRCGRRLSAADPARAVHLRHDLQGDGGRAARRRHVTRRQLRRPVRRRGVPRRDAARRASGRRATASRRSSPRPSATTRSRWPAWNWCRLNPSLRPQNPTPGAWVCLNIGNDERNSVHLGQSRATDGHIGIRDVGRHRLAATSSASRRVNPVGCYWPSLVDNRNPPTHSANGGRYCEWVG